jgi:NAD(P)-dependent dehydrogenase (short-subunit alcohol dehydrogenase family)
VLWSGRRFWEIPVTLWDDLIDVGLRSHFIASRCAAATMIEQGHGLIVNVASHAAGRTKTAGVLAQSDLFPNVSEWKEPIFTGRVVAALAIAGNALECSGEALVITDLAEEFRLE